MKILMHNDIVRCKHPYTKKEEYGLIIQKMDVKMLFVTGHIGSNYWRIDSTIEDLIEKVVGKYNDNQDYWDVILGKSNRKV